MAGAWVKLIPARALNPKLRRAGLAARGLDEAAMCWSSLHGTDGFMSTASVAMLAAEHGTKAWRPLVDRLVKEERWDETEGGWQIRNFLEFNPSAAEWEALRQQKSAAGKASARARGSTPVGTPVGTGASPPAQAPVEANDRTVSFRFEETRVSSTSDLHAAPGRASSRPSGRRPQSVEPVVPPPFSPPEPQDLPAPEQAKPRLEAARAALRGA